MTDHSTNEPAFGGHCAMALSTGKADVQGSAKHQLEQDGRTFYFKHGAAKFAWKVLPNRVAKADQVWKESHA